MKTSSGLGDKLTSISTAATRIANPHLPAKAALEDWRRWQWLGGGGGGWRRRWCSLISNLQKSTAILTKEQL
ncbi:MAG: hypothetical protein ACLR13_00010 [Acutalibacteraceae bacterium]